MNNLMKFIFWLAQKVLTESVDCISHELNAVCIQKPDNQILEISENWAY